MLVNSDFISYFCNRYSNLLEMAGQAMGGSIYCQVTGYQLEMDFEGQGACSLSE